MRVRTRYNHKFFTPLIGAFFSGGHIDDRGRGDLPQRAVQIRDPADKAGHPDRQQRGEHEHGPIQKDRKGSLPGPRRLRGPSAGPPLVELAFMLPILVVLVFGVVDFGRLIHARLVVTNVSREGGSLASRDIRAGQQLITMLQSSAAPFDLRNANGRIWVTRIRAGHLRIPTRSLSSISRTDRRALVVNSSITGAVGATPGGLSSTIYNHLQFNTQNNTVGHLGGHRRRGVLSLPAHHAAAEVHPEPRLPAAGAC